MKKILVISIFPAPYRVGVFQELDTFYQLDVFFEFIEDQSRSPEWFVRNGNFHVLNTPDAKEAFAWSLHHLKDYDLVLAYDYNNKNAGKVIRRCIRRNIPYCVNCDGAFIRKNWLKDRVKHWYISHAWACFASGRFAEEYFRFYGAAPERIFRHRFTSLKEEDLARRPLSESEKQAKRAELGLSEKRMVLSIGQFIPRKGYDVLLKAWKDLDASFQLVLIGGGEQEDAYRAFIEREGLQNVVLKGFLKKDQIDACYQLAELFVLPTREDIWGLVINEAMASGLPVVSTDRCIAAMELLGEEEGGFVVPVEDAGALAQAVNRILSDDAMRRRMGERNRKAMEDCTIEQIAKKHVEVIERL